MEVKELRLGNYYNWRGGDAPDEGYNEQFEAKDFIEIEKHPLRFRSIKLTEEWHNKFGVKMNGFMSFEYKLPRKNTIDLTVVFSGDYVFLRQGKKPSEYEMVTIWNTDLTKRDMYVHEWQNWYNLLSGGEELTIKD